MVKFSSGILSAVYLCLASGCASIPSDKETMLLTSAFDINKGDGWIVPKRPDSLWSVGQIIEIHSEGYPESSDRMDGINNCIPIELQSGDAPQRSRGRELNYNVSLSSALGLPTELLIESGANSNHKSTVVLNSVQRTALRRVRAEGYIRDQYNQDMSQDCKAVLTNPKRYIISEALVITDAEVTIKNAAGAKIDLNSSEYKKLQSAAADGGYDVSETGNLVINKPIPVAVRLSHFDSLLLNDLNVKVTRPTLSEIYDRLAGTNSIVADRDTPNPWLIGSGVLASVAVAVYLFGDGPEPTPSDGTAINIETALPVID